MTKRNRTQTQVVSCRVLTLVLGTGLLLSCGANAQAKPATKPQALKACQQGCVESASKALGDEQTARLYCAEMCSCLVDVRFDEAGRQKKSTPEVLQAQAAECDARARAKTKLPAR